MLYKCANCGAVIAPQQLELTEEGLPFCPSCFSEDTLTAHQRGVAYPLPCIARHFYKIPASITREDGAICAVVHDGARDISGIAPIYIGRNCQITLGRDYLNNPDRQDFIFHHELGHFMLHHLDEGTVLLYPEQENAADRYAIACGCEPGPFLAYLEEFAPQVRGKWYQRQHAARVALLKENLA